MQQEAVWCTWENEQWIARTNTASGTEATSMPEGENPPQPRFKVGQKIKFRWIPYPGYKEKMYIIGAITQIFYDLIIKQITYCVRKNICQYSLHDTPKEEMKLVGENEHGN